MDKIERFASSFTQDPVISIELADGGQFSVPEGLLCASSPYFRKALRGDFQESSSKTLRIPDCTSDSFKIILYWIYRSQLPELANDVRDAKAEDCQKTSHSHQVVLTMAWIVCEMLLMAHLQNDVMRELQQVVLYSLTISAEALRLSFESSPPHSPIRRLLLKRLSRDLFDTRMTQRYTSEDKDALASVPGFLQALIGAVRPYENVAQELALRSFRSEDPQSYDVPITAEHEEDY